MVLGNAVAYAIYFNAGIFSSDKLPQSLKQTFEFKRQFTFIQWDERSIPRITAESAFLRKGY